MGLKCIVPMTDVQVIRMLLDSGVPHSFKDWDFVRTVRFKEAVSMADKELHKHDNGRGSKERLHEAMKRLEDFYIN